MLTIKKIFYAACVTTNLIFSTHSFTALAATANVSIVNFAFIPATTNINVGDRVIWTWGNGFHSTTSSSSPALWDSGANGTPFVFTNTFNAAGNFPYLCTVHGFTGTVNVIAPNLPPFIAITNPVSGAVFSAPAAIKLAASATDSDGTITNVQFFQATTLLTNVKTSPFVISVTNLGAADYTFSAIASDNGGLTATNAIIVHVVIANPILLGAPKFSAPNFSFHYTANTGLSYVIQSSTNLFNWNNVQTNLAASASINFTNLNATNNPAFYRVGLLPNP